MVSKRLPSRRFRPIPVKIRSVPGFSNVVMSKQFASLQNEFCRIWLSLPLHYIVPFLVLTYLCFLCSGPNSTVLQTFKSILGDGEAYRWVVSHFVRFTGALFLALGTIYGPYGIFLTLFVVYFAVVTQTLPLGVYMWLSLCLYMASVSRVKLLSLLSLISCIVTLCVWIGGVHLADVNVSSVNEFIKYDDSRFHFVDREESETGYSDSNSVQSRPITPRTHSRLVKGDSRALADAFD